MAVRGRHTHAKSMFTVKKRQKSNPGHFRGYKCHVELIVKIPKPERVLEISKFKKNKQKQTETYWSFRKGDHIPL